MWLSGCGDTEVLKDAEERFGGAGALGGDGQEYVLELGTRVGVENVALASSQGHQWPRRAAR
ncbi:MAG TPA: hypothetical protein VJT72_10215 [Pseudonocardiaceae bacterium]|nr:hypothetical protein [Pseudonocardiaceae bacterium]